MILYSSTIWSTASDAVMKSVYTFLTVKLVISFTMFSIVLTVSLIVLHSVVVLFIVWKKHFSNSTVSTLTDFMWLIKEVIWKKIFCVVLAFPPSIWNALVALNSIPCYVWLRSRPVAIIWTLCNISVLKSSVIILYTGCGDDKDWHGTWHTHACNVSTIKILW